MYIKDENISKYKTLHMFYENGLFNDYSDSHILIRIIKGEKVFGKYLGNIFSNNESHVNENLEELFINSLDNTFGILLKHFDYTQICDFVKHQLAAGKENYDIMQFFSALSETNILKYFLTLDEVETAIYEPKVIHNGPNPEARIKYKNGYTLNIEVKTPHFNKDLFQSDTIFPLVLLDDEGISLLIKQCKSWGYKCELPRINKIVDFINDTVKKFKAPESDKIINLLVLNWTYTNFPIWGYLEPTNLLSDCANGIIYDEEIAASIGISDEFYTKVTAILCYRENFNSIAMCDLNYIKSKNYFNNDTSFDFYSLIFNHNQIVKYLNFKNEVAIWQGFEDKLSDILGFNSLKIFEDLEMTYWFDINKPGLSTQQEEILAQIAKQHMLLSSNMEKYRNLEEVPSFNEHIINLKVKRCKNCGYIDIIIDGLD